MAAGSRRATPRWAAQYFSSNFRRTTVTTEDPLRILLVDDEAGIRQGLGDLLRTQGHEVRTADAADSAIDDLRNHPRDLLITDLKMEGRNGLDLIRTAREVDPDLSAMVVTGYATLETALDAIRLGLVDFIEKPFRAKRVLSAVASCPRRRKAAMEQDGTFSLPLDLAAPSTAAGHVGLLLAAERYRNPARAELQTATTQVLRTLLEDTPVGGSVNIRLEAGPGEAQVTLEVPATSFEPSADARRLLDLLVDEFTTEVDGDVRRVTLIRHSARRDPDICRIQPEDAEADLADIRLGVAGSPSGLPVELDLSECEALSAEALRALDEFVAQTRAAGRDVAVVHASVAVRRAAAALGLTTLGGPDARPEHLIRNTLWS
jgi:DNA-binding response OmpR family regulator